MKRQDINPRRCNLRKTQKKGDLNYNLRTDEQTKEIIKNVGSNYDNRIVAIKYLKVLCRKGVLSDGIYERLVLKERKLLEENQ